MEGSVCITSVPIAQNAVCPGGGTSPGGQCLTAEEWQSSWLWLAMSVFILRAQENRYVGFGNTVPPQKREDDFLNNAMSSLYSVRRPRSLRVPPVTGTAKGLSSAKTGRTLYGRVGSPGAHDLIKGPFLFTVSEWSF